MTSADRARIHDAMEVLIGRCPRGDYLRRVIEYERLDGNRDNARASWLPGVTVPSDVG